MKLRARLVALLAGIMLLAGTGSALATPASSPVDGPDWLCVRVLNTNIGYCLPGW